MTERENIFARWSRLKRDGKPASEGTRAGETGKETGDINAEASPAAQSPTFDPALLPSIDSISASTDIRDFLKAGVPAHLTRAALRRAWTTDPAIRDFIEMAENQWDFTNPDSIPGFGSLGPSDNIARLVNQAMGKIESLSDAVEIKADVPPEVVRSTGELTPPSEPAGIPRENQPAKLPADTEGNQNTKADPALQHGPQVERDERAPNRRAHGGALPR